MREPHYVVTSGLCGMPRKAIRLIAREYLPMATAMDTVATHRSVNVKVMHNREIIETLLDTTRLKEIILKYHTAKMGTESILLNVWELNA